MLNKLLIKLGLKKDHKKVIAKLIEELNKAETPSVKPVKKTAAKKAPVKKKAAKKAK